MSVAQKKHICTFKGVVRLGGGVKLVKIMFVQTSPGMD